MSLLALDPSGYSRRCPEETPLHGLVSRWLPTFMDRSAAAGGLPGFVTRTLREYLTCGLLTHGFARVRCPVCCDDLLVARSCKRRGVCPSCDGRRMGDTAARLVDRVLPDVPVRQWVLSFPWALRRLLAYNAKLTSAVLAVFISAVERFTARAGEARHGTPSGRTGSVTVVQRFGSALNLNPHFHALFLDGIMTRRTPDGPVRFVRLRTLTDADVASVLDETLEGLRRLFARRGEEVSLLAEDTSGVEESTLALQQLALGALDGTSPLGPPPTRDGTGERRPPRGAPKRLCADMAGFSLHAATTATHRSDVEVLCRYILRPPLSLDRLTLRDDGDVELALPRPWSDGTTTLTFDPLTFISRLVPLIPAPRSHQIRYHGVLAPNAAWRREVVLGGGSGGRQRCAESSAPSRARLSWAQLLKRCFDVDVLRCARCGARREVLAVVMRPEPVRAILTHLDLVGVQGAPRPPPGQLSLI